MDIQKVITDKQASHAISSIPIILDFAQKKDSERLEKLVQAGKIKHIVDNYKEQEREYFESQNPSLVYNEGFKEHFQKYLKRLARQLPLWMQGMWVYFPWSFSLVHILDEEKFFTVRTNRNRELITEKEQKRLQNTIIGIAGLSIGSSVATALAMQGIGRYMKLADYDKLALSNTNRIISSVEDVGFSKAKMSARQLYGINPYITIKLFHQGLTKNTIIKFVRDAPRLNIIIDEIDDFGLKYLLRRYAKKCRIPVIMGIDNADNAVIMVERYDKKENTEFFNGRFGKVTYRSLQNLNKQKVGALIGRLIGNENIGERMKLSVKEIGKTLVSWPQLGGTALINGSAVASIARKIILGENVEEMVAVSF